jgi:hypothetical protein
MVGLMKIYGGKMNWGERFLVSDGCHKLNRLTNKELI